LKTKGFDFNQAPVGQRIRLTFVQTFKVTCDYYATYGPCDQDWLEVRTKKAEFDLGGPRFCCNIINPAVFESDSNEMLVLFYSTRNNVDSTGFIANYEFISSKCRFISWFILL
jgi:CUB domain